MDAVKRDDTAKILWRREKRILGSVDAFTTPFFVRVKGTGIESEIEAAFGDVTYIEGDPSLGETAFITKVLSGSEYDQAAQKFDIINRIRVSE